MNNSSWRISTYTLAAIFLLSGPALHAFVWNTNYLKRLAVATVVGAVGYRYLTKKSLTETELAKRHCCTDDEISMKTVLCFCDDLIGQQEKEPIPAEVDLTTGKITSVKRPATGIIGKAHTCVKKYGLPLITLDLTLGKYQKEFHEGIIRVYTYFLPNKPTPPTADKTA